jgi:hypothetical protein
MVVSIVHGDGTVTVVSPSQYSVSGTALTINTTVISNLASTDQLKVDYEPSTVF